MTYDLRREPWIPWRRSSGGVEWGRPALLVDRLEDDPVVALAAPRPDFDGALQEFLVGLLTAAVQPVDEREWRALWMRPPSVEVLQAALDALPPAFDLDGDGPRFFQDLSAEDVAAGATWGVESLLIDAPGSTQTQVTKREFVSDLFVKPGRVHRLSRPAAAMALLTMQSYAPEGGRGHLTSMRGGGPLTTLVDPRVGDDGRWLAHERPLWHKLWSNVETGTDIGNRTPPGAPTALEAAFPWLAPTRAADSPATASTTPAQAHPFQAYFGFPRRIRLEFEDPGVCDLTGERDGRTVTAFRMKTYGVAYAAWRHPLSPYYRGKATGEWLALHGQPGGVGWRDWLGLAVAAPAGARQEPALVVSSFMRRARGLDLYTYRLHVFGYDTEHKKARGWTEAALPAFIVDDEQRQSLLYGTAAALTDATGMAGTALLGAVKRALFQDPDEARGDFAQVRADLWAATEGAFYEAMAAVAAPAIDVAEAHETATRRKLAFVQVLRDVALEVFDRWCPAGGLAPDALRRRVVARYDLSMALGGFSKRGEKMFDALGIPHPGGGRAARASKRRSRKEAAG
jgi:CRISPR system Cascade subunit CasA